MPLRARIFHVMAGNGHLNTALSDEAALKGARDLDDTWQAMLAQRGLLPFTEREWQIEHVDLRSILGPIDPITKLSKELEHYPRLKALLDRSAQKYKMPHFPLCIEDVYDTIMQKGIVRPLNVSITLLHLFIAIRAPQVRHAIARYWAESDPADIEISVLPHFNQYLWESLRQSPSGRERPFVIHVTDIADCRRKKFWKFDPDPSLGDPPHYIAGSEMEWQRAKKSGFFDTAHMHPTSGMAIHPRFYQATKEILSHEKLGLDPEKSIALVMFGGKGATIARDIAGWLSEIDIQSVVICGRDEVLYQSLQGMPNCHAVRFTQNVADYMRFVAQTPKGGFFIGKPGPASMSEAIHMGLALMVSRKAMPQEKPNLLWLKNVGAGHAIDDFSEDEVKTGALYMMAHLERFKTNIADMPPNLAVFEAAKLFNDIVDQNIVPAIIGHGEVFAPSYHGPAHTQSPYSRSSDRFFS